MTTGISAIYHAVPAKRFELCHPLIPKHFETFQEQINGVERKAQWQPVEVELVTDDLGKPLRPSDSPWLGDHALVFRTRVVDILGSLLEEYGELLPLRCSTADLVVFNPTRILAALDENASEVWRFPSGAVMGIRRHALKADVICGQTIFKLTVPKTSSTFLGQQFVDAWRAAKLKGLEFDKIWPT